MIYKYKSFLLLLLSFVLYVDAQGNCNITDPNYVQDWTNGDIWIKVNDDDFNFEEAIQTEHITNININHKYMEGKVENNVLIFSAKPEFQNFIQNEEDLKYERVTPVFSCADGIDISDKYILLNVIQNQQFPPKFTDNEYKFHLAMPILANTVIESTAMTVEDFNIGEQLTFALSGGDAECTNYLDFTTPTKNKKMYTTKLKTKKSMNLEKSITCDVQVTDLSGKTDVAKVIIDVDVENSKVPDPIFEEPIQIVNYVSNLKTSVKLLSTVYTPKPTIRNDNKYAKYFKTHIVANNIIEIELNGDIPEDEFGDENYFVLLVEVEYEKADNKGKTAILVDLNKKTTTTTTSTTSTTSEASTTPCDCSTVTPGTTPSTSSTTTCAPWEPAPEVRFLTKSALVNLDKGSTGLVETFKAVSDISNEKITYAIETVEPTSVKNMFEITQLGEVKIVKELDEGTYEITITAFGKESKSTDKATLFLVIKHAVINCPDNSIQVERLVNTKVIEGEAKRLIDTNGNRFEFTTDNEDIFDWFKFNKNDGALEVLEIDREDKRIKSLLAPQIQVKIRALPKNTPPMLRYNFSATSTLQYSENEYSCLAIKNIDTKADTMLVVVTVEDVNDNPPVFNDKSPLIVGYPETKLINLIAPPYLVKVTATDEDFGDHAKIKYSTNNKNFVADAENGIIFLGSEISDNTEFKVIAEDNDGNGGNKAELVVNVKLLKEEHISVITVENIAYSEIEDLIEEISSLTKQTVKYLSSTALPKVTEEESEETEEKSLFKMYSDDEKIPAIRIILYALNDNNEVIPAKDFKEIADGTDLGVEINVQEYAAELPGDQNQGGDNSGWIAAVSTLSVLLALVIIGGLLGYIFYLRPRMMESVSDGYQKHVHRDSVSVHSSSIETKMEVANTLADRRPTGFPVGFKPQDLDEEEDEVFDTIKEENTDTGIEIKDNESITSSSPSNSSSTATSTSTSPSDNSEEDKPKSRVGVKFDTNVTEIEIEEF